MMPINISCIKFHKAVGKRIQALRKMYGWDKRAFQDKFGINRTTMFRIENGTHTIPLYTVATIAKALNTTVLDLMADTEFSMPVTEENLSQMVENIRRLNSSQQRTIITLINQFLTEKDNDHP
jgi:transcriptional regulator with XRE-family HTH domain